MLAVVRYSRHPVIQNFKIILGGNIATQIVSLATYSLIARLYSTEAFGLSAVFISLTFIFSIFQSGQLYWTFLSGVKSDEEQLSCYYDCLSFLFLTTPILLLVCLGLNFSSYNKLGWLIVLVPIFSFSYSLIETNKMYLNAIGEHKKSAAQVFFSRSLGQLFKIVFSVVQKSGFILIVTELTANLIVAVKGGNMNFPEFRKRTNLDLFKKYKNTISYYTPVNLINLIIQELPVLLATYKFGLEASGSYFLISRLILNPMTMVGNSFANSQIKKVSSYNHRPIEKFRFLLKSNFVLIAVGFLPSIVLFFFGKEIFEIFLGKGHSETVHLIKYISLLLPFRLIKALSQLSGISSDLYKDILLTKATLIGLILLLTFFVQDMSFEMMVVTILALETTADIFLSALSLVKLRSKASVSLNHAG